MQEDSARFFFSFHLFLSINADHSSESVQRSSCRVIVAVSTKIFAVYRVAAFNGHGNHGAFLWMYPRATARRKFSIPFPHWSSSRDPSRSVPSSVGASLSTSINYRPIVNSIRLHVHAPDGFRWCGVLRTLERSRRNVPTIDGCAQIERESMRRREEERGEETLARMVIKDFGEITGYGSRRHDTHSLVPRSY